MNFLPIFKRFESIGWKKAVVATGLLLVLSGCNVNGGQLAGASSSRAIEGDVFLPVIQTGPGSSTTTVTDTTNLPTTVVTNTVGYSSEPIPGQYIVVFKSDVVIASSVDAVAATMVAQYRGTVTENYDAALIGFAAQFPAELSNEAVAGLQQDPRVAYVEQDKTIKLNPTVDTLTETDANQVAASASEAVQLNATWGLDRIDQRTRSLDTRYNYLATGAGVRAYIIDTGINIAHTEFGGRASLGYSSIGGTAADCNGHGTHVAGTIGGATYGVAKGVSLIAVRVLDCYGSGSSSSVIAGVNWVTQQKRANPALRMVANMSLGGSRSTALDSAVNNSITAGVIYVVAAGNDNTNACNVSPAGVSNAITVGAMNNTDVRAYFSNFGICLDIFAPGVNITSAWYTSNSALNTISGTSMASPHVAGVVALYLQSLGNVSPATVAAQLRTKATPNVVLNPGPGSPNYLLFSQ